MKNTDHVDDPENIINYWLSAERFIPPEINTKDTYGTLKSIQQVTLKNKDIPWKKPDIFKHEVTQTHTWIYTIFLGAVELPYIAQRLKKLLTDPEKYDEQSENLGKGTSCICSFKVNHQGIVIPDTFIIPDYFLFMSCFNQVKDNPKNYDVFSKIIQRKLEDTFQNKCDALENRNDPVFQFEDFKELLDDLIQLSGLENFDKIKNECIIYSNNIKITKKQKPNRDDQKEYSDLANEIQELPHDIINSFYVNDISYLNSKIQKDYSSIGTSLKEYLGLKTPKKRYDFRADKLLIKKHAHYSRLPAARWPTKTNYALSIAQQIAVNIALSKKEGMLSVNGPPGTGKSTLLRDIVSGIVFKRAQALSKFDKPSEAFSSPSLISVQKINYKVWKLDPSLLGHEIVIASTNNFAVENISKEIPRKSEVDDKYNLDYFSEIAPHILESGVWGLGAAVLGNKKNCTSFFDRFLSNDEEKPGLRRYLDQDSTKSDWLACKKKFLQTKAKFDSFIKEMEIFESNVKDLPILKGKLNEILVRIKNTKNDIDDLDKKILEETSQLSLIDDEISSKNNLLATNSNMKPPWYIVLIDLFSGGTHYKDWHTKSVNLMHEIDSLHKQKKLINKKLIQWDDSIKNNEDSLKADDLKIDEINEKIQECIKIIESTEKDNEWHSEIPKDELWSFPDSELQIQSPWIHKALQDVRAELFVDAMNLHKSFIINSSDFMKNNLNAIKYAVASGNWPLEHKDLLPHMWAAFFLVIPTVSTTFASFFRLFGDMESDSIGNLLVDEAGQTSPQSAVGAIYRAKKAIIVGDPLQIQPVVTVPRAINQALLKYYNVSDKWDVLEGSLQTIADRANEFGSYLAKNGHDFWIGCPLRVHRRCQSPMFDVSNQIAYDNTMIQATKYKKSLIEDVFPSSTWVDIPEGKFEGNWCPSEGEAVLKLVAKIINDNKKLPSLYIISPFKHIPPNMKKYLKENKDEFSGSLSENDSKNVWKWIDKSIGTIHTFQGKQAEAVILLLGGNPDKISAIDWASSSPNILNVAITRAKNLLLLVGNYDLWSKKPHFEELSKKIENCTVDKICNNKIEIKFNLYS